jgi:hypothetical protein
MGHEEGKTSTTNPKYDFYPPLISVVEAVEKVLKQILV